MNRIRQLLVGANCLWAILLPAAMLWPLDVQTIKPDSPDPNFPTSTTSPQSRPALSNIEPVAALFDRRIQAAPVAVPDVQAVAPPLADLAFRLLGLLEMSAERIAIIQGGQPPKVARLREGESFGDWTLMSIQRRSIEMKNGEALLILELDPLVNASSLRP